MRGFQSRFVHRLTCFDRHRKHASRLSNHFENPDPLLLRRMLLHEVWIFHLLLQLFTTMSLVRWIPLFIELGVQRVEWVKLQSDPVSL